MLSVSSSEDSVEYVLYPLGSFFGPRQGPLWENVRSPPALDSASRVFFVASSEVHGRTSGFHMSASGLPFVASSGALGAFLVSDRSNAQTFDWQDGLAITHRTVMKHKLEQTRFRAYTVQK